MATKKVNKNFERFMSKADEMKHEKMEPAKKRKMEKAMNEKHKVGGKKKC